MRGKIRVASLAAACLMAGACSSSAARTEHPSPGTRARTGRTAVAGPVTKAESLAAINAACTSFYRLDPPDLAADADFAVMKTYARARLKSVGAALHGVDAVPLRPTDESLRHTVRNNFTSAKAIYDQVIRMNEGADQDTAATLMAEAQRLVITTGVALINYGAQLCAPSADAAPVPPRVGAGPVVELAPVAAIRVAERLLNNDSIVADEHDVWVGVSRARQVVRIDTRTNTIVARVSVTSDITQPIRLIDGKVWVATQSDLERIDPATNRVDWALGLGSVGPPDSAFTARGTDLLACDRDVIHRIDIPSKTRQTDVATLPGGCQTLDLSGNDVLTSLGVPNRGMELLRVDLTTHKTSDIFPVPARFNSAWGLLRTADGRVFLDSAGRLMEFDLANNRISRMIDRGGTTGNQLAVGGGALWTTRADEHRVLRLDLRTNRLQEIMAGAGVNGLAYRDGSLWVTNSDAGTVMRYQVDPWPFPG